MDVFEHQVEAGHQKEGDDGPEQHPEPTRVERVVGMDMGVPPVDICGKVSSGIRGVIVCFLQAEIPSIGRRKPG